MRKRFTDWTLFPLADILRREYGKHRSVPRGSYWAPDNHCTRSDWHRALGLRGIPLVGPGLLNLFSDGGNRLGLAMVCLFAAHVEEAGD